ncbi:sensor histidine kinase [Streptomyces alfalfae]|uniref:histidine kinase n=1 Tax=Streptomyces alfalfae TaxID=1642299 RepID=A0A1P8TNE6_9ACTN|nr:ATP-binding protein [Streptomyces alfalfae]AYA19603.1 sensor histidine kinase [Streptomyces fradiae]APY89181.1 ATPase [Streptomyces alfalfae]QQC88412.1 sensor histidine kinase [Streptomyces alfalfae]QUI30871.1 sensor histidine kinase [Streptomyces alfalfae]RXX40866.1 sensor histidine kinase [Streptomyces alfalfae]
MVSVQSPPGGREIPYVRALLLPATLMAAATGAAVATVTEPARPAVIWCGAFATLLVVLVGAEVVRRGRTIKGQRAQFAQRLAHLERRIASHDDETVRLGRDILPEAHWRLQQGEPPAEVIRNVVDNDEAYRELPRPQRLLLRDVLEILDHEEAMRESAQRAFVNIARRVQSIVHQQAAELREMEEFHGRNPEVFDDLLRIDHGTALIGRLADSISVLGGARPGRQWPKPVPLYSVLRGAMSRILDYPRVELHSIAKVAIHGTSVEPLIHACAELLDNATRYSPPQTKVHVTAVEVQSGIAVEIEDGGVSLSEEARERAERMLAQAQAGIDLNDLGESPRLGMAVVGRLSQMYNMQISLRQSAYGGVRAVLIVPREMITTGPAPGLAHGIGASAVPRVDDGGNLIEEPERNIRRKKPRVVTAGPPLRAPLTAAMEDEVPEVTEWTPGGLPQRRSRVTMSLSERYAMEAEAQRAAEAHAAATAPPPVPAQKKHETEPGLWIEAFMKGVKGDPAAPGQTPPQGADPAQGTTPAQESHRNNHGIADEGGWQ